MQDLRSISIGGGGGGGGFGGGGGGGRIFGSERRLRPFPNQAMKCPRCDSLNTKFCYYNNYNLSQPRHFCKNCRRYWTKGGVLRNVPVGGGCRKTKRSKPKSSTNSINGGDKDNTATTTTTKLTTTTSRSSSDSSSLTATTTTDAAASSSTTSAAGGGGSSGCAGIFNFGSSSSGLVISQNTTQNSIMQLNHNLDQNLTGNNGIFAESGSFTNLMNDSSNQGYFGFNLSDISPFRLHHHHQEHQSQSHQKQQQEDEVIRPSEELKMTTSSTMSLVDELKGFYDQNGLTNRITGNGELTALDWQQSNNNTNNNNSLGLFDLPGTVVDQSYWSQSNQWTDNDHPLYLP